MKETPFIHYFSFLLKKLQELQQSLQIQDSFRIVSIETNSLNECIFKIQMVGKSTIFQATPQEIAGDDLLLEGFSRKDVRIITYHATKEIAKPPYKILVQNIEEETNKILFKLGRRGEKKCVEKTADQLSSNKDLLNQMTQQDAYRVGYVAATEFLIREKEKIKVLNEKV